ncbi:MAG: lipopolysaccharide biosynthesis protein [Solirubrobacterales bacterium]
MTAEGRGTYGRGAALLSALIGVTGLLTYAFHSLAAHALGRDDYGVVAVLWAAVFLVASVIYRPVEQLLSRTLAERRAQGRPVGAALRVGATIQGGLVIVFVAVALLARDPIEDELFSGSATLYWCLVAAVSFYAASYFARGFLAGEQRFGLYGGLVLMESASRLVFAVLLIAGVLDGRNAAGVAIAAAPLLSLFVVPWALGRHVRRRAAPAARGDTGEPEMTLAHGLGFASAVLVIMVSEQAILNSGVLIVKADTGDDALAALIFAVLMIARAPLQLFQAVSTTLLPHLTRLLVREGEGHAGDFGRSVRLTVAACLAFGGATVLGVLAVGPPVMRLLFGSEFDYDRLGLALVAAGMGLYLSATTVNQAVLAQGRARLAAASWATAAVFFVGFLLLADMEEVREVEVAFLATAGLLSVLLYLAYRRPLAGERRIAPGSTEELEAILAAADEGS